MDQPPSRASNHLSAPVTPRTGNLPHGVAPRSSTHAAAQLRDFKQSRAYDPREARSQSSSEPTGTVCDHERPLPWGPFATLGAGWDRADPNPLVRPVSKGGTRKVRGGSSATQEKQTENQDRMPSSSAALAPKSSRSSARPVVEKVSVHTHCMHAPDHACTQVHVGLSRRQGARQRWVSRRCSTPTLRYS